MALTLTEAAAGLGLALQEFASGFVGVQGVTPMPDGGVMVSDDGVTEVYKFASGALGQSLPAGVSGQYGALVVHDGLIYASSDAANNGEIYILHEDATVASVYATVGGGVVSVRGLAFDVEGYLYAGTSSGLNAGALYKIAPGGGSNVVFVAGVSFADVAMSADGTIVYAICNNDMEHGGGTLLGYGVGSSMLVYSQSVNADNSAGVVIPGGSLAGYALVSGFDGSLTAILLEAPYTQIAIGSGASTCFYMQTVVIGGTAVDYYVSAGTVVYRLTEWTGIVATISASKPVVSDNSPAQLLLWSVSGLPMLSGVTFEIFANGVAFASAYWVSGQIAVAPQVTTIYQIVVDTPGGVFGAAVQVIVIQTALPARVRPMLALSTSTEGLLAAVIAYLEPIVAAFDVPAKGGGTVALGILRMSFDPRSTAADQWLPAVLVRVRDGRQERTGNIEERQRSIEIVVGLLQAAYGDDQYGLAVVDAIERAILSQRGLPGGFRLCLPVEWVCQDGTEQPWPYFLATVTAVYTMPAVAETVTEDGRSMASLL